jgi:hypothetical protein
LDLLDLDRCHGRRSTRWLSQRRKRDESEAQNQAEE